MACPNKVATQIYGSAGKEWTPHFWQGMDFIAWMRLLSRNRFKVELRYLYIAVIVTFVSVFHTIVRFIQDYWYGERIRRTPLTPPPLFIIGHWRTGTTHLHELLILDPRHRYANTYQCMEPNHFLLSEKFLTRLFWFFTPSSRPMDNMPSGWDRPQEDEFALGMMGQPCPYLSIAFPNNSPVDQDAYDLERLSPRARRNWKKAFTNFLKTLTYQRPGRLILKSPTHTCRIPTLLEMFPDALFVHIVRDPHVVFPSTVNLWKALAKVHGLQTPTNHGLEERVFETFNYLYEKLEESRGLIDPARFHELRYEDLVRDPEGEMKKIYDRFGLGDFQAYQIRLKEYLAKMKDYKTNQYDVSEKQKAAIAKRWGAIIRRYGYEEPASEVVPPAKSSKPRLPAPALNAPHFDAWPQPQPEQPAFKITA